MHDYQQQKLLYRKLMDKLVEENRRTPLSRDKLAERIGEIYEQAFPIKPYLTE